MKFENMTAIVTGAGGNIGGAIAKRFAAEGAGVAVVDFSAESAKRAAVEILRAGGQAKDYVCGVSDYEKVRACFEAVKADFGKADILVTAAGGSTRSRMTTLARQSPEVITGNIGVNLFGAMWFAKEMAAHLEERGAAGRLIFTASILGVQGRECCVEYSAGKAGIIAMSKSLAKELGHLGATVNCVSPGLVNRPGDDSDVRPANYLGQYCTAEDITDAVEFLASDAGKFITGHNLIVDGGRSLGLKGVK